MGLAERYFEYNRRLTADEKHEEKHDEKINELKLDLERRDKKYKKAKSLLDKSSVIQVNIFNSNICVNTKYHGWEPLQKYHFVSSYSDKEISKAYRAIRKYLRIYDELSRIQKDNSQSSSSEEIRYHFIKKGISDTVIDFLYKLTGGDKETLIDFAKLCAHVFKKNMLTDPIVILAHKSIQITLMQFFECLLGEKIPYIALNGFLENRNKLALYNKNLNINQKNTSSCAAIITSEKIPDTETSVRELKKLMTGKTVKIPHPSFSGDLYIKNNLQFVFMTDEHKTYLKLKNIYGAKGIVVSTGEQIVFNKSDVEWFKTFFSSLGERWILNVSSVPALPKIDEDDIFDSFVEKICVKDEDAICTKVAMYEAYKQFYLRYYGQKPLSQTVFGKRFAIHSQLETVRPHNSRSGSYRHCFKGIDIDEDKYETFLKTYGSAQYVCSREVFTDFLNKIIDKEFPGQGMNVKTSYK